MVKKDYLKLYIGFGIAFLFFMLAVGGGIAFYQFESFFVALNYTLLDMLHFKFHFGFTEVYLQCYYKALFIYILVVTVFAVNEEKYRRDAAGVEAGSAKWNDNLKKFSKKYAAPFGSISNDSDENMILSEHARIHIDDMATHHNNNVIVVGPAGKGKSRFYIKPNILQANCSFVVTDPSGELLDTLGKEMEDLNYTVKIFNLVNMGYSNQYNPFYYINEPKDVGIVVDCFLKNTTPPEESSSDPFWEKSETALLTAIIFYLKFFSDEDCQNFRTVLQMVQYMQLEENATREQETKLDKIFNGKAILVHGKYHELQNEDEKKRWKDKLDGSLAWENYTTFKLGGAKTLKSVLMSAAVRLNPFLVPEIANLTAKDTLKMDEIGDDKTIVFVMIPQSNMTYNFLASMLFAQTFEALYYKAGKRNEGSADEKGLRYKYHIRFLMDEYANIGNIPGFPNKISTMRKYNMSATVVLQSTSQIKQMHKDDYETIISNCDTNILLGANDITTAEYYSKLMGKGTIRARSVGYSSGKKKGSSLNYQQTGRELMTIDEIRGMPFNKCIVLVSGEDPIYDDKFVLENHPRYKDTGDSDPNRRFNLMNSDRFLNTVSKIHETIDLKSEESIEAKKEVSEPQPIGNIGIKAEGNAVDPISYFNGIQDSDRTETVSYLIRMKHLTDQAVAKEKRIKQAKILCVYLGAIDPRLMLGFTHKYNKESDRPIVFFCHEITDSGLVRGYFTDDEGYIRRILTTNGYTKIEELSEEETESVVYCVKDIRVSSLVDIKESLKKGLSIVDEFSEDDSLDKIIAKLS